MSRAVAFGPSALAELTEAIDWYVARDPGLGTRLLAEVDAVVRRIAASPLQFPPVMQDVRRARLSHFPYSLFFRLDGNSALVLACFHSSRNPSGLLERFNRSTS